MANKLFAETHQVVSGFVPVESGSATDGDWVSFKHYNRCTVVYFTAVGTAGDDPTLTFGQATVVAGTGDKPLAVVDTIHHKADADLTTIGINTKVTQTAAATYTDATHAELQKIYMIDVMAEDLDVAGGFDCMRVTVADVGTTGQLSSMIYIMSEPRYGQDVLESAIVD